MSNFIEDPLEHPEWDPSKGDYYNKTVFAEDKQHKKNLLRKKILVSSLALAHIVALALVFIYLS